MLYMCCSDAVYRSAYQTFRWQTGLVQKSITSPGPDWYQSGPMAAMLGGVDIGIAPSQAPPPHPTTLLLGL